jgi:hypothetical protein
MGSSYCALTCILVVNRRSIEVPFLFLALLLEFDDSDRSERTFPRACSDFANIHGASSAGLS